MKAKPRSGCPISLALDVIGDKWSLLVLRDIVFEGKQRYQEFLSSEEKISTNILADRLDRLEALKIISKKDDPASGRQFLYAPTQKGIDLVPALLDLARWSNKYDAKVDKSNPNVNKFRADREKAIREILSRFKGATHPGGRGA